MDEHRKSVESEVYGGNIDLYQCDALYDSQPKAEFLAWIEKKMKNFSHVQLQIDHDSTKFELFTCELIKESDHQVYTRLQKEIKSKMNANNKEIKQRQLYEKLKKIYE